MLLGSEEFIAETMRHIPNDKDLSEIPLVQKRPSAKPLAYLKEKYEERDVAIVKTFESGVYRMKEIEDYFGLHYSTVSRIVKRVRYPK